MVKLVMIRTIDSDMLLLAIAAVQQIRIDELWIAFSTVKHFRYLPGHDISPRARGVSFVLKGPYDPRVPPIVKFSQEFESARLTKIILSKSTVNP